jgi:hypothetical protein
MHSSFTPLTTSFFHVNVAWEITATHPPLEVVNGGEDDADTNGKY